MLFNTSIAGQHCVCCEARHGRVLPDDDVAGVEDHRVLRHLLEDLPLVEQRPHHPVEVVVLLILGLVVGVLPEGKDHEPVVLTVNSLKGLVSLVVIVDPFLGCQHIFGREDTLQMEPAITLEMKHLTQDFLRKVSL